MEYRKGNTEKARPPGALFMRYYVSFRNFISSSFVFIKRHSFGLNPE